MLMSNETIIELYNEAYYNGDPAMSIKSLAKANNVKATAIKSILVEAGCDVPDHIPRGPVSGDKAAGAGCVVIEPADPEPGEGNMLLIRDCAEDEAIPDKDMVAPKRTGVMLPIPETVKKALAKELDALETRIEAEQKQIQRLEAEYETIAKYLQGN